MKIIRSKGLFAMIGEEEKPYVFVDNSEEYRKCLEEIREIAKREYDKSIIEKDFHESDACIWVIIRKINEVLNEKTHNKLLSSLR